MIETRHRPESRLSAPPLGSRANVTPLLNPKRRDRLPTGPSGTEYKWSRGTTLCWSDKHVVNVRNDVGGHREANTLRTHGLGIDSCVHAHDLASHINKGAAGVARVDCRVRLDETLELGLRDAIGAGFVNAAVLGGDDASGHRL